MRSDDIVRRVGRSGRVLWVLAFLACQGLARLQAAPMLAWDFETGWGAAVQPGAAGGVSHRTLPTFADAAPRATIEAGEGVGGGAAVDFGTAARGQQPWAPPTYTDPVLHGLLSGATSLTVCFWLRGEPAYDRPGHDVILWSPGIELFLHEAAKDHPAMALRGTGGRNATVWATRNSAPITADRWTFYAFTVDTHTRENNCLSYSAGERDSVTLCWTASAALGPLCEAADGMVILGARSPQGAQGYPGRLDGLRVFASRSDRPEGALSRDELEAIRLRDLGPGWPAVLAQRDRAQRQAEEAEQARLAAHYAGPLRIVAIDPLSEVFPDRLPPPLPDDRVFAVPRKATTALLFALRAQTKANAAVSAEPPTRADGVALNTEAIVSPVGMIPVEANTNGGSRTAVGRRPPEPWLAHFVREAPFEVGEVLTSAPQVALLPGRTAALALLLPIPAGAEPGLYRGVVRCRTGAASAEATYTLRIGAVDMPDPLPLHVSYWLSPDPRDLTNSVPPPGWWEEAHWQLVEQTAKMLHDYGQDCILTPVIKGPYPLTRVTRRRDGSYDFDFAKLDRWIELFLGLGYRFIEGHHLTQWGPVHGLDGASGTEGVLVKENQGETFLDFVGAFCRALHAHLEGKGWSGVYSQHLIDECREVERYRELAERVRQAWPGIKLIDAINSRPMELAPMVDIAVLSIDYAAKLTDLIQDRREAGRPTWYYNCCSPAPPLANRHLDEPLTSSRLYPWYAFRFSVDGYLNWGANIYRGADPYRTSVGPVPNGSQNPGHPPGDNWHFYPTAGGLVPGLRMLAFREGLIDHALLTQLARKDSAQAQRVALRLAASLTRYSRRPEDYHEARQELLRAVEQGNDPR